MGCWCLCGVSCVRSQNVTFHWGRKSTYHAKQVTVANFVAPLSSHTEGVRHPKTCVFFLQNSLEMKNHKNPCCYVVVKKILKKQKKCYKKDRLLFSLPPFTYTHTSNQWKLSSNLMQYSVIIVSFMVPRKIWERRKKI